MQKFRGGAGALLGLLVMFLMIGVSPLWLAWSLPQHESAASFWTGRIVFGLMGLLCIWYFGWGLLEWFTVYEVDTDGISRRAWNGSRRLYWSDLTRFKASGHKDGSIKLTDSQNGELTIHFSLLNARNNLELREIIAPHLDGLRERQLREIGILNTVYRPNRERYVIGGVASLLLGAFFFTGVVMSAARPTPDVAGAVVFGGVFLLILLLGAWMLILAGTRTLAVTQEGIVDSSRFGSRTLLFHQITALMTREVMYKGDKWEITRLQGDAKRKIVLTSKMEDYPLLVEFIRARVPPSAQQQGEAQAEESKVKERKQERVIIPVCAAIILVMFTGFGLSTLATSVPILAQQRQIDAQGRTMRGQVTRHIESGGKNDPYRIEFAFTDGQQQRVGVSPVLYSEYQQARTGDAVEVQYVPGQPALSRLTHSISRRRAVIEIVTALFQLLCGLVLMPYVVYITFKKK